jgi:hypothetical protein
LGLRIFAIKSLYLCFKKHETAHARNEFDISKLVKICDSKFDDLYWKIQKGEVEGLIIHDIEPDEGLMNPYELYYDGKIVKASKVSTPDSLRGEAYMCFEWPTDNK